MLAAQAKGSKEPLADRGDVDGELAEAVGKGGESERGLGRSLVLNDLQCPQSRALHARPGQVEASVADRPQQNGAARRQVGIGVGVSANADGMGEDSLIDVLGGIDIDAPHQLDEHARLGRVGAAGLVHGLPDEMKGHRL